MLMKTNESIQTPSFVSASLQTELYNNRFVLNLLTHVVTLLQGYKDVNETWAQLLF